MSDGLVSVHGFAKAVHALGGQVSLCRAYVLLPNDIMGSARTCFCGLTLMAQYPVHECTGPVRVCAACDHAAAFPKIQELM